MANVNSRSPRATMYAEIEALRLELDRERTARRAAEERLAEKNARPARSDFVTRADARRKAARVLASKLGRSVTLAEVDAHLATN